MTRVLRIGLPILGVIVALGLVLVAAPFAVSGEGLRRRVAIEVSALTGQPVTIQGGARFATFPWPMIVVDQMTIGEAQGGAIVETTGIEARLSLLPLLRGRVELNGLVLVKPKIVLAVDKSGRSNWRSGSSLLAMLVPDAETAAARLGEFGIQNGAISYRDDQAQRRSELADVDVSISWPLIGRSLSTSGRFSLRGEPIRFSASLDRPSALFRGDISPFALKLDTKALNAEVSGNAYAVGDIQLEGKLKFTSPSIRAVVNWLVPEAQNAPDIGPVSGVSDVKIADRTLSLDDAKLTVSDVKGEGALALTFDKTRSSIQGTLDFDQIDASPFVQMQIPASPDDPKLSSDPVRVDRFGPVDVDLRLSTASLQLGGAEVKQAAIAFLARDGRIEASIGDGRWYDGRITGRLLTEVRQEGGVRVRAALSLANIKLDDPLREYFGIIRLTGLGSAAVNLMAEGTSMRQLAASLRGDAALKVGPGAFAGLDMSALIRRADRNPVDALLDARGGRSVIDAASALFKIENGIATTEDGVMRGPGYRLTLKGNVNATARNLLFNGLLSPQTTSEAGRIVELPFIIRGPIGDPVLVPSPDGFTRRSAVAPATPAQ